MYCFKSIISFYLIIVNSLVITKLYSHNPESSQTSKSAALESIPLIPNTITNKIPSLNSTIGLIDMYDMFTIESIYRGLEKPLRYLPKNDLITVKLALTISYLVYFNKTLESGEMFINHPIAVTTILADSKVDVITIVSSLLHDSIEKSNITYSEIESLFGKNVHNIVKGITAITKLTYNNKVQVPIQEDYLNTKTMKNEHIRNMFLSMAEDSRIIIIKLAERLHFMRTLQHLKKEQKVKISLETMDIYAPLAKRIGIWRYVQELEDLSFKCLYPTAYNNSFHIIHNRNNSYSHYIEDVCQKISSKLHYINFKISGRTKSVYSAWKKSEKNQIKIEDLRDIVAIRIIIEESPEVCYSIIDIIHSMWKTPIPNSFKDYIANPKKNGYQSLHTTIILENNFPIEIQVKTRDMHRIATVGTAAHWKYKPSSNTLPWLEIIKDWNNTVNSSTEFVELIRKELLYSRIFVFIPNGQVISIKRGQTLYDLIQGPLRGIMQNGRYITLNGKIKTINYCPNNGDIIDFVDEL